MKKETKPIDDAHVTAVGEQLDHALAKGPAPPRARTRQALIDLYASKLTAMRQAHFSLEEIANALSYKDVVFSSAMVSTYCSRSSALNASSKGPSRKSKPKTAQGTPTPRTRHLKQPAQETGVDDPLRTVGPDKTIGPTSSASLQTERIRAATKTLDEQLSARSTASYLKTDIKSKDRTGIGWMDNIG